MNHKDFAVHLDDFDGPLALLYKLIKTAQINIYDIPIATITDQYVSYLKHLKALDVDLAGEYFVLAADLMVIKSRLLLPDPVTEEDDDSELEDPRTDLVKRLLIYQQYQKTADHLDQLADHRAKLHSRTKVIPNLEHQDYDHLKLGIDLLTTAFHKVSSNQQQMKTPMVEVTQWNYSVRGQAQLVRKVLQKHSRVDLVAFLEQHAQIEELVTTFLAILEMAKLGQLLINQQDHKILLQSGDNN